MPRSIGSSRSTDRNVHRQVMSDQVCQKVKQGRVQIDVFQSESIHSNKIFYTLFPNPPNNRLIIFSLLYTCTLLGYMSLCIRLYCWACFRIFAESIFICLWKKRNLRRNGRRKPPRTVSRRNTGRAGAKIMRRSRISRRSSAGDCISGTT